MNNDEWTPERIRAVIAGLRMTQQEFADRIGVKLRAVQRWVADRDKPAIGRQPTSAARRTLAELEAEVKRRAARMGQKTG